MWINFFCDKDKVNNARKYWTKTTFKKLNKLSLFVILKFVITLILEQYMPLYIRLYTIVNETLNSVLFSSSHSSRQRQAQTSTNKYSYLVLPSD